MIEKYISHSIAFLNVFVSGIDNQNLTFQIYQKLTYTSQDFALFSCHISLIKSLIDRLFKICKHWNSFHKDIEH